MIILGSLNALAAVLFGAAAASATDPYIGIAAVISALAAGTATVITAMNRRSIHRHDEKLQSVERQHEQTAVELHQIHKEIQENGK